MGAVATQAGTLQYLKTTKNKPETLRYQQESV